MKTENKHTFAGKKNLVIVATALLLFAAFGCDEKAYIDGPGDNRHNQDSLPQLADPDPTPDPVGVEIPAGALNVNEAVKIAKKLKSGEVSKQKYFIKGWVSGFNRDEKFATDFPNYGNDFVYLSARNDGQGTKKFYAYRLLGKFGAKLPDLECVTAGDFVVISCYLTNYSGVYESSGACFVYASNNEHFNTTFPAFKGCPAPGEGEISVTDAEAIALTLEKKATTNDTYKIRGVVTDVADKTLSTYGNLTFNISDGLSYATCYRLKGKNNGNFTNLNQVQVGDTVLVNAKIQNYNGTCEPVQGYILESTNPNF